MTANADSDRIIRAWLDLMPDEAPDRAIDAVLHAAATSPQERRSVGRLTWRPIPMNRALAAVAAAVLVAVGAFVVSRPSGPTGIGTSSPPTASAPGVAPSATSSATPPSSNPSPAAAVPSVLQHRWMGGPSPLMAPGTGSNMAMFADGLNLAQSNLNGSFSLTASASAAGGHLTVTSGGRQARCPDGQVGTYAWTLSPSGRTLTLSTVDDPCAIRSEGLDGTWWLMGCKNAEDNCLGPLDAGTFESQFVNFARPGGDGWSPAFGAITYTVPDGWANDADWPSWLGLTTQTAYANWSDTDGDVEGIAIDPGVVAEDGTTPCSGKPAAGVARAPGAIIASLRSMPGLVVGATGSITVNGRAGSWVDLSLDDAKLRPCGSDRVVEYLVSGATDPLNTQAVIPGHRNRLILVPGPVGIVGIVIDAEASRFDTVVGAALQIIGSLRFQ
jgi:hypothetical protein